MSSSLEDLLGLGDADPTPPLRLPTDTPDPAPDGNRVPTPVQPNEELEKLRERQDRLERENQELRARVPLPQERTPGGFSTTIQPGLTQDEAKAKLEAAYLADPVGFLMNFGQLMSNNIRSEIRKEQQPFGSAITQSAIENFKRGMATDPMFAAAEPEFDRLLRDESANLDPARMGPQLDALYSTAYGNTLRKRPPEGRENHPPNYALGSNGAGSADSGRGASNGNQKLTEEDRIYLETMRESGYKDEDILKMMKARTT